MRKLATAGILLATLVLAAVATPTIALSGGITPRLRRDATQACAR